MSAASDIRLTIVTNLSDVRRGEGLSPTLRDMLLRSYMERRHEQLLTLIGGTAVYLCGSFALLACTPIVGWWLGLAAVPLSLLGAADGRAWRDLRYRWEPPIVLPTAPIGPLLNEER